VLIGAFLVLVGVAAVSLFSAGEHALAAVVAIAGAAGVGAGAFTYWLLRRDVVEDEDDTLTLLLDEPPEVQPPVRRGPVRVHSMPIANLPPAYVDAVLRGAQARLSAIKAQANAPSAASPRH
jgi:hypothetical protein